MAAKKEAAKKLKITLVRSTIGQVPKARATVAAMGLKKMHQTVELPDNAATRGPDPESKTYGQGRRSIRRRCDRWNYRI